MNLETSKREDATILCALRLWQVRNLSATERKAGEQLHALEHAACAEGPSLDAEEIQSLIERLSPRPRKKGRWFTKIICGRRVRLRLGETYLAATPIAGLRVGESGTVNIYIRDSNLHYPIATVENLTRAGVTQFLRAFNNGKVSFAGRTWSKK